MQRISTSFSKIALVFLAFCAVGWLYETINDAIFLHTFVWRADFIGPWCPIYGIGGLLIMFVFEPVRKLFITTDGSKPSWSRRLIELIVLAVGIYALTTAVELAGSYACEAISGTVPWDYSECWGNFEGRIAPVFTIRFVIGGLIFLYLFIPWIKAFCDKQPRPAFILSCVLLVLFAADLVIENIGGWDWIDRTRPE